VIREEAIEAVGKMQSNREEMNISADEPDELIVKISFVILIGCVIGGFVYFLFLIVESVKAVISDCRES
jgi:hypothetical protein